MSENDFEANVLQALERLSKDVAACRKELLEFKYENANQFENTKSFILGIDEKSNNTAELVQYVINFMRV